MVTRSVSEELFVPLSLRASECILLVRFETHRERMVMFVYAILFDRLSWHFNMENSHGQEKSRDSGNRF